MELEQFITVNCVRIRAKKQAKPRVHVWQRGETILENLQNRHSRPIDAYKAVARRVLRNMDIECGMRWSQKAGCGCGCSPGLILDTVRSTTRNRDIHITTYPVLHDPSVVGVSKTVPIGK